MKKIILYIITILIIFSSISYAQQLPLKDVCIYPIYTSQFFGISWTYDPPGAWMYEVYAVHYVTNEIIDILSTPDKSAEIKIDKSGIWELKVRAVNGTTSPYASTLNEDTCIIDGLPQKWVIYTSPAPPGDPIFD